MPIVLVVEPIVAQKERVGDVWGLHGAAEAFDYACSRARAEAIDALLLAVLDERGWSLFDDEVLDRVTVEHHGPTRARILIDGRPVTPWWDDRLEESLEALTWHFEPAL
jgi:hypothetical protein